MHACLIIIFCLHQILTLYLFKILILELEVMKSVEDATKHGKIM